MQQTTHYNFCLVENGQWPRCGLSCFIFHVLLESQLTFEANHVFINGDIFWRSVIWVKLSCKYVYNNFLTLYNSSCPGSPRGICWELSARCRNWKICWNRVLDMMSEKPSTEIKRLDCMLSVHSELRKFYYPHNKLSKTSFHLLYWNFSPNTSIGFFRRILLGTLVSFSDQ